MGKGSGKAKVPKDKQFDKDIKEQGPGLSDPRGPLLQLTALGGFPGQIDWSQMSFGDQLAALPDDAMAQIALAGQPLPAPVKPVADPKKKTTDRPGFVNGKLYHHPWGLPNGTYKMPENVR